MSWLKSDKEHCESRIAVRRGGRGGEKEEEEEDEAGGGN